MKRECLFDAGSMSSEKSRIRNAVKREKRGRKQVWRLQAGDRRECSPH